MLRGGAYEGGLEVVGLIANNNASSIGIDGC
jgi:hypothetical protein